MKYQAIFLPLAKQDVKQAAIWYNTKQKGLGKRFTVEVRKKVKFIYENPKATAIRYKNVRTTLVNAFPYAIHYTIEKEQKIVITAVMHSSQNPNLWEER